MADLVPQDKVVANRGAKKSLGQHFLVDKNAIQTILNATQARPRRVIEIGPGRGAITLGLAALFDHLVLIEKDHELAADWRDRKIDNLTVIEADATNPIWISRLSEADYGVVGNLPYNAATVILRHLLEQHDRFAWMVLMFQKEVADRILYAGERRGGVLGVLTQMIYDVDSVLKLGPAAFKPRPKVDSRVVRLRKVPNPLPAAQVTPAWKLLTRLYQRRRARLDKAISQATGQPRQTVQSWFEQLEIRADARPDHVDAAQYRGLLDYIWDSGRL